MFYQSDDFIGYAHIQGMYPFDKDNWSKNSLLYFISVMKSVCGTHWDYSNKFNRKLVAKMQPLLPIQTDKNNKPIIDKNKTYHKDGYIPDFEFMEQYITVIQKLVIKDVVQIKDEIIQETKQIIEN